MLLLYIERERETHSHKLGELEMFSRKQIWSSPLDMEGQIEIGRRLQLTQFQIAKWFHEDE